MHFNCTALFEQAEAAMLRIPDSVSDREPGQKDALTSIVLTAASLEGFINEALESSEFPEDPESEAAAKIAAWAALLAELEVSRASLQAKYQMTKWVFSAEPFDKGAEPYQNFNLLLDLRNSIMHLKAVDRFRQVNGVSERVKAVPIIDRLRSHKILGDAGPILPITFIDLICTRATARWACASAASMIAATVDVFPPSGLKATLKFLLQWFRVGRLADVGHDLRSD